MELVIAVLPGLLIGLIVVHLLGLTERSAKIVVRVATVALPRPLRARVIEECYSEIDDVPSAPAKLYIAFTCVLDGIRLGRMWRSDQLGGLPMKNDKGRALQWETAPKRHLPDLTVIPEAGRSRRVPNLAIPRNGKGQWRRARLRWFLATLKSHLSLPPGPNRHGPQRTAKQLLLVSPCSGKVWRLDGGTWVKTW